MKEKKLADDFENFRYERKFVLSELTSQEIERIIRCHPANFKEIFYERTINNIYFDSLDLKNYHDHLSGSADRFKIRIRWYGKIFGEIKNPVIEIKAKKNELGKKTSFPIKNFVLDEKFSLEYIQKIFSQSNVPFWLSEELKLYMPVILNSYKRKYFSSNDKRYRLTIDKEVKFYEIRSRNNLFFRKYKDVDNIIIELKYQLKDFEKAKEITEHFPFRLGAYSKYVTGINLLDLWVLLVPALRQ